MEEALHRLRFFQVAVRRILGADPRSKALFHDRAAWGARTQVAATAMAVFLMDVIGRRRMLLASALVCTASMLSMGLLHTLATPSASGAPPSMAERLPVPLMAFFVAGFSLGLGPVTWLLAAELVPLRDRGLLMGVTCAFNWVCAFAVTLFFESVHTTFKFSGLGWFFSSVSVLGSLLVAKFLPETSRRSLEQILIEAPKEPVELPSARTGQIPVRRAQIPNDAPRSPWSSPRPAPGTSPCAAPSDRHRLPRSLATPLSGAALIFSISLSLSEQR
ncbi:hypothetical protein HPB47_011593 [Ixodes persulcatus]|uniref:Uncharacterized protein n=1 Tax=Ixodes persulcatus TaxID=34615 RepID=A0AC60NVV7_IXOPE|nr:hypothetical protein HPB47_011593 [Ixodes persulcatus]